MVSTSSSAGLARHVRRSVAWHRFREYVNGALWVLPTAAALVALAAGYVMSQVTHDPDSLIDRLAFQGTGDDARALLITVSSTVVTVIALVLGLTVVALQLSSTQFSPRLLRNFLRDRPNQVVLSAFVATFAYSAAGLYTVGHWTRPGGGITPVLVSAVEVARRIVRGGADGADTGIRVVRDLEGVVG